jgi:predicted secreted protein
MDSEYYNGSDLLISIGGKAVGHCTTHTTTMTSETKERAVKPEASKSKSAGKWKEKGVTGLSIAISFEGLRAYDESENGYTEVAAFWGKGEKVEVIAYERGNTETPYLKGNFIIDQIEESSSAQDDVTYSGQLSNSGEPDVYPGKATA